MRVSWMYSLIKQLVKWILCPLNWANPLSVHVFYMMVQHHMLKFLGISTNMSKSSLSISYNISNSSHPLRSLSSKNIGLSVLYWLFQNRVKRDRIRNGFLESADFVMVHFVELIKVDDLTYAERRWFREIFIEWNHLWFQIFVDVCLFFITKTESKLNVF